LLHLKKNIDTYLSLSQLFGPRFDPSEIVAAE